METGNSGSVWDKLGEQKATQKLTRWIQGTRLCKPTYLPPWVFIYLFIYLASLFACLLCENKQHWWRKGRTCFRHTGGVTDRNLDLADDLQMCTCSMFQRWIRFHALHSEICSIPTPITSVFKQRADQHTEETLQALRKINGAVPGCGIPYPEPQMCISIPEIL